MGEDAGLGVETIKIESVSCPCVPPCTACFVTYRVCEESQHCTMSCPQAKQLTEPILKRCLDVRVHDSWTDNVNPRTAAHTRGLAVSPEFLPAQRRFISPKHEGLSSTWLRECIFMCMTSRPRLDLATNLNAPASTLSLNLLSCTHTNALVNPPSFASCSRAKAGWVSLRGQLGSCNSQEAELCSVAKRDE